MSAPDPLPVAAPDAPPLRLRPFAGFGPVFGWGLRLAFRGRRFLLVALLAVAVGALLGSEAVRQVHPLQDLAEVLDESILRFVLPLVALTLVAQGYSREIQERTLVFHLVRPVSRTTVFLGRFLSGLVPASIVAVLLLGALFLTAHVDVGTSTMLLAFVPAILGVLAIGAVYYFLAAVLKHGVVAGLVYTFAFESLVSAMRGSVQKLSVMFHVRSLHHRLTDAAFGLEQPPLPEIDLERGAPGILEAAERIDYDTPTEAVLWLLGITVVFLALGVWRTRTRDFALKD